MGEGLEVGREEDRMEAKEVVMETTKGVIELELQSMPS